MHLISWNVAGWATTVECIKQRHGSVESWIERHNVDILCLQEVKLTSSKLAEQPTIAGITPSLAEKYDMFFACCSVGSSRGFNGVATFCRKGLTVSSDPQPLGEDALDAEGRALVTIHDDFAVLNVYVPNDGPGSRRLPFKMRFLRAVEECMSRLRHCGLKVFLVGDLNIGRRPEDISWDHRVLSLSSFVRMELPDASCSRDMHFLRSLFTAPCCSHCGWHGCQCRDCFPPSAGAARSRSSTTTTNISSAEGEEGKDSKNNGSGRGHNGRGEGAGAGDDASGVEAPTPADAQQSQSPQQQQQQASTSPTRSPSSPGSSPSWGSPFPSPSSLPVRGTCRFCRVHWDDDEKQRTQKRIKHLRACLRQATALQTMLRQHWPLVTRALESRVVEEQEVKLKRTNTQVKYRVSVRGALGRVRLGQPCETKHRAERMYTFDRRVVKDEDGSGDAYLVRNADEMCVAEVVECLEKIAGVSLADYQQRCLAMFAGPISSPPCVQWLNDLLEKRGYLDTFTTCYPMAQARFTCHDQYKNRRYENAGSRIDYIVLDAEWQPRIKSDPSDLISSPDCCNPFCAMCALSAVTLNGRWKPAPYDGTGMVVGKQEDYCAHFTRPRTGVVYTPPQYSDHLAISIVMDVQPATSLTLAGAKTTRSAQPHRAIKRISSFFTKRRKGKAQQSAQTEAAGRGGGVSSGSGGGGGGGGGNEERSKPAAAAVEEAAAAAAAGLEGRGVTREATKAETKAAAEGGDHAAVRNGAQTEEGAGQHKVQQMGAGTAAADDATVAATAAPLRATTARSASVDGTSAAETQGCRGESNAQVVDAGANVACDQSTQESNTSLPPPLPPFPAASSASSSSTSVAPASHKRKPASSSSPSSSSSSSSAAKKAKGSSATGRPSRSSRSSSSSSGGGSGGGGGAGGKAGKAASALKKRKGGKNGKGKKAPPPGQRKISAFFQ